VFLSYIFSYFSHFFPAGFEGAEGDRAAAGAGGERIVQQGPQVTAGDQVPVLPKVTNICKFHIFCYF
jgi:hypothetical protein